MLGLKRVAAVHEGAAHRSGPALVLARRDLAVGGCGDRRQQPRGFIDELSCRRIPVVQVTPDELQEEIDRE